MVQSVTKGKNQKIKVHTQPTELTLISQPGDADLTNISIRANISKMSDDKRVINTLDFKKN